MTQITNARGKKIDTSVELVDICNTLEEVTGYDLVVDYIKNYDELDLTKIDLPIEKIKTLGDDLHNNHFEESLLELSELPEEDTDTPVSIYDSEEFIMLPENVKDSLKNFEPHIEEKLYVAAVFSTLFNGGSGYFNDYDKIRTNFKPKHNPEFFEKESNKDYILLLNTVVKAFDDDEEEEALMFVQKLEFLVFEESDILTEDLKEFLIEKAGELVEKFKFPTKLFPETMIGEVTQEQEQEEEELEFKGENNMAKENKVEDLVVGDEDLAVGNEVTETSAEVTETSAEEIKKPKEIKKPTEIKPPAKPLAEKTDIIKDGKKTTKKTKDPIKEEEKRQEARANNKLINSSESQNKIQTAKNILEILRYGIVGAQFNKFNIIAFFQNNDPRFNLKVSTTNVNAKDKVVAQEFESVAASDINSSMLLKTVKLIGENKYESSLKQVLVLAPTSLDLKRLQHYLINDSAAAEVQELIDKIYSQEDKSKVINTFNYVPQVVSANELANLLCLCEDYKGVFVNAKGERNTSAATYQVAATYRRPSTSSNSKKDPSSLSSFKLSIQNTNTNKSAKAANAVFLPKSTFERTNGANAEIAALLTKSVLRTLQKPISSKQKSVKESILEDKSMFENYGTETVMLKQDLLNQKVKGINQTKNDTPEDSPIHVRYVEKEKKDSTDTTIAPVKNAIGTAGYNETTLNRLAANNANMKNLLVELARKSTTRSSSSSSSSKAAANKAQALKALEEVQRNIDATIV